MELFSWLIHDTHYPTMGLLRRLSQLKLLGMFVLSTVYITTIATNDDYEWYSIYSTWF